MSRGERSMAFTQSKGSPVLGFVMVEEFFFLLPDVPDFLALFCGKKCVEIRRRSVTICEFNRGDKYPECFAFTSLAVTKRKNYNLEKKSDSAKTKIWKSWKNGTWDIIEDHLYGKLLIVVERTLFQILLCFGAQEKQERQGKFPESGNFVERPAKSRTSVSYQVFFMAFLV